MAQVSLRDVKKVYPDGKVAVEPISLGIENKEFVVFLGPSGCGKSTILRMIAGLETPTEGKIWIGDRMVNDVPPKDRNIAMVFQNYALYPHKSVFENIAFGLRLRRYKEQKIAELVDEAAEILGIKSLLKKRPREISGGERQRVAIGRAIVRKPLIFLFDEPLSNLDAKLRVQMRLEIHRLRTRLQTTFIWVTHDQIEAMTLADRIVVFDKDDKGIRGGKVQQVADPVTIYNRPANKFVADFIGSPPINFMEGRIIKKERKLYFDEGKFQVKLVDDMYKAIGPYEGKQLTFGIRPESIYDKLFVSQSSPDNTVRVTCEVVESLGSEVLLNLNSGRHTFIARVGANDRPEVNRDMDVVFDMSKAHFFDKETGQTII